MLYISQKMRFDYFSFLLPIQMYKDNIRVLFTENF